MKVLYLHHDLGYGGATKSLLLMQKAVSNTTECYAALNYTKNINEKVKKEFIHSKEFVVFDIPSIYSYSERSISINEFEKNKKFFPSQLIKYINDNRINILHVNSTLFAHILKHIKKHTRCKIVVHLREMLPFGEKNIIDKFIIDNYSQYADAIVAISDNEAKYFNSPNKLFMIPNPHDFESTDFYLNTVNKQQDYIVIGMCANFLPIKGHLVFVNAARIIENELKNKGINTRFQIIGYPVKDFNLKTFIKHILHYGYQYEFDQEIKKTKISNFKITPFTFNIYEHLSKMDIYVRPDLSGNPWGRDIIEAMALKKPIVAAGESEFFVENNATGFLVPVNNPEQLADRIIKLIYEPRLRYSMGEHAYLKVKRMCDLKEYGQRINFVYESIL